MKLSVYTLSGIVSLVAALASLTTLQSEILNARAAAVGHIRSKVSLR
jgi:hypothetical protein